MENWSNDIWYFYFHSEWSIWYVEKKKPTHTQKKTNNNEMKMSQLFFPVSSSIFLFSLQLKEIEIFAAAGMLTSFDKIKMF